MREQLFQFVNDARKRTLELVSDLADEQLIIPQKEIVNPFRWEFGSDRFLLEGAENLYDSFNVGNPLAGGHDDRGRLDKIFQYTGGMDVSKPWGGNGRERRQGPPPYANYCV